MANLIVTFASRIFEIETGKWPASPDALIGTTLPKLPDDFLTPDDGGGDPINPDPASAEANP